MAKAGGDISGAVELLNKYLEMYVPTYLPGGGGGLTKNYPSFALCSEHHHPLVPAE